jgi:hypothetical protein
LRESEEKRAVVIVAVDKKDKQKHTKKIKKRNGFQLTA